MDESQRRDLDAVRGLSPRDKLEIMHGLLVQAVMLKAAWIKLNHPEIGDAEVQAKAMRLVAGARS
jgi:hypothetical protein